MSALWQQNILEALQGIAGNYGETPAAGFDWRQNCLSALQSIQAGTIAPAGGLQVLYSDESATIPASSGAWLQIPLEAGVDSQNVIVNFWETVTPTPTTTTNMTTPDEASGVVLVGSSLQLEKTAGSSILSRLVTTAGAADYVPGVTWSIVGSPSQDSDWWTLGSGDCLTSPLDLPSTGDFTAECWMQTSFASGEVTIFSQSIGGGSKTNTSFLVTFTAAGQVKFYWSTDGSTMLGPISSSGVTVNDDAPHHIAITRNANTLTLWVDGNSQGTATLSGALFDSSRVLTLGGENGGGEWTGKVKQFRLSNSCWYTATFTPADPLPGPTWTASGYSTSANTIDAIDVSAIDSFDDTVVTPSTTSVKYAWSFDGGSSWQVYLSGAWSDIELTDVAFGGMTASQIDAALTQIGVQMSTAGAVTRLAFGLTTANGYSPTALASITTSLDTEQMAAVGVDFQVRRISGGLQLRSTGGAITGALQVLG